MGCFGVAGGCGSDDNPPGSDAGLGGDSSSACSITVVVTGCNTVEQNNRTFDLGCSSIVNRLIDGRPVCAVSGQCVGGCLDPMTVHSCMQNCSPRIDAGGGDASSSALGTSCDSNADCSGGLTCLRSSDNIVPGAGPPNGVCTVECTAATQNLCESTFGGVCVRHSDATTKSFCAERCSTGEVIPQEAKCHGRHDSVCTSLDTPGSFACVPVCETDADCGTRKCDLGTGFCADVLTPGLPVGSPCIRDSDCAGLFCYPFEIGADATSSAGVCTAVCRLGNLESCHFRTSPLDAGPPVGACLLAAPTAHVGDVGICAQLCDSVNDCGTVDPRWTCELDPTVRMTFGHAGFCWLGVRPDGGRPQDASVDAARDSGAPEASPPEASPPEAAPEPAPESGVDGPVDVIDTDVSPD
jgi:hypothetical protein